MTKLPISVFIITKNEETHITKALTSVARADEIIVVDSGSTDRTVEIAKEYGAKVVHHDWMGFAKQKQYALSLCSNEWVLNLDGDETANEKLFETFENIIKLDKADGVRFWRNDFFIGKKFPKITKRDSHLRFYKKSKSHFDSALLVHEHATVDGKKIFINADFDHYGYDTVEALVDKNNNYSSLKAKEKYNKGKSFKGIKLILVFLVTFIKKYFIHRRIFFGYRGFILSMIDAFYAFLKEAKLYELNEKNNKHKSE